MSLHVNEEILYGIILHRPRIHGMRFAFDNAVEKSREQGSGASLRTIEVMVATVRCEAIAHI